MRIRRGVIRKRGILSLVVLAVLLATLAGGATWLGFFSKPVVQENVLRGPYVIVGEEHLGSDRQLRQVVEEQVRPALTDLAGHPDDGIACGVLYDYPWNAPRSSRRTLAGVMLPPDQPAFKAEPPLHLELIARRNVLVVSTTAHPSVASLVIFPKIRRWLAKNHMTPTGPLLELYRADGTMEVEVPLSPLAGAPQAVPPASPGMALPPASAPETVPPATAAPTP